jgi:hypothetical protein
VAFSPFMAFPRNDRYRRELIEQDFKPVEGRDEKILSREGKSLEDKNQESLRSDCSTTLISMTLRQF